MVDEFQGGPGWLKLAEGKWKFDRELAKQQQSSQDVNGTMESSLEPILQDDGAFSEIPPVDLQSSEGPGQYLISNESQSLSSGALESDE